MDRAENVCDFGGVQSKPLRIYARSSMVLLMGVMTRRRSREYASDTCIGFESHAGRQFILGIDTQSVSEVT